MFVSIRSWTVHWKCALLLAAVGVLVCSLGAVRRRITIRSNPPGALVFIDDQEIGFTPISTAYTYYGTRKIQLIKDGFETLTVKQTFSPPWYQVPPIDFVSENLWPRELRDERVLEFQLIPQQIVPTDKLLERAESLRGNARQGQITPLVNPQMIVPPPTFAPQAAPGPALPNSGAPAGSSVVPLPLVVPPQVELDPRPGGPPVQRPFYP